MKYTRDILFHYEIKHSMATPIRKCCAFFYPFLSVFCKDQNNECPLRKFEKFSVVLEKLAVNIEVRKKEVIAHKGQGKLNLAV